MLFNKYISRIWYCALIKVEIRMKVERAKKVERNFASTILNI